MSEPAGAAIQVPPELVSLSHEGHVRAYLAHVPPTVAGSPPLLVELSGRGVDPIRFDQITGLGRLADEAGFVLAMPSAREGIWNDGRDEAGVGLADDVGYLVALIDDARSRWATDPERVYVAGMSNGAAMAGRLACERPERIAA